MSATRSSYARPAPETLARLYAELGLSCPDIGWLYERDAKTVHYWLRQDGIPTRHRGSNAAQHFQAGQATRLGKPHTPESIRKIRSASIARGAVPYLRDGKHWLTGAAPDANPNWKGGATPERQEFYRTEEWKAACIVVWRRANACCERCGLDYRSVNRDTERFHVHHIVPFAVRELRAAVLNLVLLCRGCHLFVHSKANADCEFIASPLPEAAEA
jgi:hypothetical protein